MRIKMLETRCGSENGFTIRRYCKDEEYELADELARSFITEGFAASSQVSQERKTKSHRGVSKNNTKNGTGREWKRERKQVRRAKVAEEKS